MDELSVVLQGGNGLLRGQEQVQAVRVSAAECPGGALEVPVVGTRIGTHRDVGTVRPVALELQAPLAELLVGLRCPVWQANVGEDVSVEVEQRRGPAERNPPDVALHRALGDELFMEGLGAEGVVEVAGERFQGLVEVEPVPDHVAEYSDVGNLLGLQARGELGLDVVVALEDLDLAEDVVLCLVKGVHVALQDLRIVRGPVAPEDDSLTVLELVRDVTAGLVVYGVLVGTGAAVETRCEGW